MSLFKRVILGASHARGIEKFVRHSSLFRPIVKRFIAGDTLEQALQESQRLCNEKLFVTLDYLGENTQTEQEALLAKKAYLEIIDSIQNPHINISIKLTQCGLDVSYDFALENYLAVLEQADKKGVFVRVDMESSDYVERTVNMVTEAFKRFKNTGTVLQSCLYRTPEDVEHFIQLGAKVRIVKGAYLESEKVAYQNKKEVDDAYIQLSEKLLKNGYYPAIATHDEKIIKHLTDYIKQNKIPSDNFEFQMLYGIRRNLQKTLVQEGYHVRVYTPYGEAWYPYFTRRLAERPANLLFIMKSFLRN